MIASLLSQPVVFGTSLSEVLQDATLLALLGGAIHATIGVYRRNVCHQVKCHRLGRFFYGHYRLCHVHHPNVPSDGKITAVHIEHLTHDGKPSKS
jgi:hypothetical protein